MKNQKPLLLELFKGTGSVGKVFKRRGWDVVSLDIDAEFRPTIVCDIMKWDYKRFKRRPDFIWASPPCQAHTSLNSIGGLAVALIVLRAYSMGGGTYTGIEAVTVSGTAILT